MQREKMSRPFDKEEEILVALCTLSRHCFGCKPPSKFSRGRRRVRWKEAVLLGSRVALRKWFNFFEPWWCHLWITGGTTHCSQPLVKIRNTICWLSSPAVPNKLWPSCDEYYSFCPPFPTCGLSCLLGVVGQFLGPIEVREKLCFVLLLSIPEDWAGLGYAMLQEECRAGSGSCSY